MKAVQTFGLKVLGLIALSFATLGAQSAHAGPQLLGDLNLGYASFNQDYGGKFAWGLGVRARFEENFEVGVEYRHSSLASDGGVSLSVSDYLANFMYRVPAGPGHFGFGVELGEASFDASVDLGGFASVPIASASKFAVGPRLNYGVDLGSAFEVGLTIDYLIAFNDPKVNALGTIANLSYKF